MSRYDDIDPMDIDPDTGRPYSNYSSPSLDTSFHDGEMAGEESPVFDWDEFVGDAYQSLGDIVADLPADSPVMARATALLDKLSDPKGAA